MTEQWRFESEKTTGSAPVVADGRLFVTLGDDIYGISMNDGETLWRHRGQYAVSSTPVVADGAVFVGVDDDVRRLSVDDGSSDWEYDTDEHVETAPTVADGIVYAGGRDERLYALDATDGSEVWSNRIWSDIRSSPAVVDGTVYVGNDFGRVYAFDGADGTDVWKSNVSDEPIRSAVVVGEEKTTYVADDAGTIHAVEDGTKLWSNDLGVPAGVSPAVADGSVYVPDSDGTFHALDGSDGSEQWTVGLDGTGATPTVVSGTVFVGTASGSLYALDATDGSERYTAATGTAVRSATSVVDGWLFIRTRDGVVAFSEYVSAAFEYDPASPKTVETITFDASPSGPESLISSYEWSIDGVEKTGQSVQATFDTRGTYTVELTVEGDNGLTDTVTESVPVAGRPPTATIEYTPASPTAGDTITFSGSSSDDLDGEIVAYNWLIGVESKSGETIEHTFESPGDQYIRLTVRDDTGKTDTAQQTVTVSEPTPEPTPTPEP
ncbi:MAG: PQQ-binding-like beta-propeller repeat protein, partial [Halanaeroarchaeum sp.]